MNAADKDPSHAGGSDRRRRAFGILQAASVLVFALLVLAWRVPVVSLERDELTVIFSEGGAFLESSDGSTVEVVEGTVVGRGDRLLVSEGASLSLSSVDGHHLTLTDSSQLEMIGSRGTLIGDRVQTRIDLDNGEVRLTGNGRPRSTLEIGLPNGVAGVRGTIVGLRAGQDRALISVEEGGVELSGSGAEPTELIPGQGAVLSSDGMMLAEIPRAPVIQRPEPGAVIHAADSLLSWREVPSATGYVVELATDSSFLRIRQRLRSDTAAVAIPLLDIEETLFARVYTVTADGLRGWPSESQTLRIARHWALGLDHQRQGDLPGSVAEFQLALESFPDRPDLLGDLGWSYYQLGRFDDAGATYERARALDPENDDLLVELGRAYFWLEDYGRAEEVYRSVLGRDPQNAHALWGLGDTYRVTGRREQAVPLVQRALSIDPSHPYARQTLRQLQGGS